MAENISFFFSSFPNAGVHVARRIDKLGMRSSDTAEVFFDDVRLPCKNIIGQEGLGFTYQMLQFQEERLWAVANCKRAFKSQLSWQQPRWGHVSFIAPPPALAMMENIIQETIQYTRQRKIFKQPVLYHQSVRFRLAELQTELELLRSLVHRATGRQTPVGAISSC